MKVIPREVKKVVTNSSNIRQMRRNLHLSDYQKEVLIGTLLGDGCLLPNVWGKNYRLQIFHSHAQKKFVWWKYKVFRNFILSNPAFNVKLNAWRFRTISHPEFTEYYHVFYRNKKKILPLNILHDLSSLGLAVWFMDDGGRFLDKNCTRGFILNIQNFTSQEAKLILKYFVENLKIPATLQRNHGNYRLFIRRSGMDKFKIIIGKYILKELKYKLS